MISHLRVNGSLWLTAFRPFFLFGSLYSLLIILIWLMVLFGKISIQFRNTIIDWHAYEMVFGFLRAILVGFLFTAGQNWTGKIILRGPSLFGLTLLWFFGRFSFLSNLELASISFSLDLLFDIVVVFLLAKHMFSVAQKRNRIIVFLYSFLSLFHLLSSISNFEIISASLNLHFVHLAIFVFIFFLAIIAGRVLPFFTVAQIPGSFPSSFAWIEENLSYYFSAFIISEFFIIWNPNFKIISVMLSLVISITSMMRLFGWQAWKSWKYPILFVLFFSYFWIGIGFFTFALVRLDYLPASPIYHIFTYGVLAVFIFGMITRIPLGHTGRKITASILTQISYLLLNVGFLIRVIFPFLHLSKEAYLYSGIIWILSFFIYLLQFTTLLIKPRIDGKIG